MALLPDFDYEPIVAKLLTVAGYDETSRHKLTGGILEALRKVNDADRRARRSEAMMRALCLKLGLSQRDVEEIYADMLAQEARETAAKGA